MRKILACIAIVIGLAMAGGTASAASPVVGTPSVAVTSDPATTGGLDSLGSQAVDDIRRCLSTKPVLNVYYLTDSSGSLGDAAAGRPGTDPTNLRSQILGNSLQQLAAISSDVQVNWAAGFFSTQFQSATGWQALNATGPGALAGLIRAKPSAGWTNWPAAIAGAQAALAAQQATTNGCQVLVWLTDGGIDLGGARANGQTNDAINALCGASVTSGAAPTSKGIFNELRQSGVVVIGVLLRVNPSAQDASRMSFMRPLVESTGTLSTGKDISCGVTPIPSNYVHGALLEASAADQLASVFVRLGAVLSGGYQHPFASDGSFQIDPGVAEFLVTTQGTGWKLIPPPGSGLTAITATTKSDRASITVSVGTTEIRVGSAARNADPGKWQLVGATDPGLYLFSGLSIQLDSKNQLIAGSSQKIRGAIVREGGASLNLPDYSYKLTLEEIPSDGGSPIPLGTTTINPTTGKFALSHSASADDGAITIIATVAPLTTVGHRLSLASLSAQQLIQVSLPTQFPRLQSVPVHLSDLVGASGLAKGSFVIVAPPNGAKGTVCFTGTPTVVNDSTSRKTSWRWQLDGGHVLDAHGCVVLGSHQHATVQITAANSVPAYSTVQAQAQLTFESATGDKLQQRVPLQFATTRPLNVEVIGGVLLLLLLLGILIPLALLYLINYRSTRIQHGRGLMRASFAGTIDQTGVTGRGVDLSSSAIGLTEFRVAPPVDFVRRYSDPELGELRARVSFNPFASPWYEIVPPKGVLLFAAEAGLPPLGRRKLIPLGRLATFRGQLSRVWAIAIKESDLLSAPAGQAIPVRLVIFHAMDPGNQKQFVDRMAEARVESRVWTRVIAAKSALLALSARKATRVQPPHPGTGAPKNDAQKNDLPKLGKSTAPIDDLPPKPNRSGSIPGLPPRSRPNGDPPSLPSASPSGSEPPPLPPLPPRRS